MRSGCRLGCPLGRHPRRCSLRDIGYLTQSGAESENATIPRISRLHRPPTIWLLRFRILPYWLCRPASRSTSFRGSGLCRTGCWSTATVPAGESGTASPVYRRPQGRDSGSEGATDTPSPGSGAAPDAGTEPGSGANQVRSRPRVRTRPPRRARRGLATVGVGCGRLGLRQLLPQMGVQANHRLRIQDGRERSHPGHNTVNIEDFDAGTGNRQRSRAGRSGR